ncbi:hypothetical protein L7F22_043006 [Adiantum nelumboides]|nr:hypothetical protein [Adiantum nelumboides]
MASLLFQDSLVLRSESKVVIGMASTTEGPIIISKAKEKEEQHSAATSKQASRFEEHYLHASKQYSARKSSRYETMPVRRNLQFPESVDVVIGVARKWYIDWYDVEGNKLTKLHLFVQSLENENENDFKDFGQLKSVCMSSLDSTPEVKCLDVTISTLKSFLFSPNAYVEEQMMDDKEDTLFSRGCNVEVGDDSEMACEALQKEISKALEWKANKQSEKKAKPLSKSRKRSMSEAENTEGDTPEASTSQITGLGSMKSNSQILNPEQLTKHMKKAKNSQLGGLEQYKKYFPLGV